MRSCINKGDLSVVSKSRLNLSWITRTDVTFDLDIHTRVDRKIVYRLDTRHGAPFLIDA
jgi:hypothetical protein